MKFLKKLRGFGLSWLMVLVLLMTGLGGCSQADGSIDGELIGQVVSAAADIALEEMLAEETVLEQSAGNETAEVDTAEADTQAGISAAQQANAEEAEAQEAAGEIEEDGWYTSKEEVALYIHLYGRLPDNFIDKYDAQDLGWDSSKGNLDDVAPGMSIGGSKFGNREGLLPKKKGRTYYECDIDYEGGYRGVQRIVYSNDGLIYYTGDHYESFELLYTEEGPAE